MAHDEIEVLGPTCKCGHRESKRRFPASLEYQGGTVGDFAGCGCIIAQCSVAQTLVDRFPEISSIPSPIDTGDDFYEKRVRRLKYKGPPLCELWFRTRVPFNPEVSTLKAYPQCPHCSHIAYVPDKFALPRRQELIGDRWEWVPPKPRVRGEGVIVPRGALNGDTFFFFGHSGFAMCLSKGREFIEDQNWSCISFTEVGEVI